jgi:hypothetical protein
MSIRCPRYRCILYDFHSHAIHSSLSGMPTISMMLHVALLQHSLLRRPLSTRKQAHFQNDQFFLDEKSQVKLLLYYFWRAKRVETDVCVKVTITIFFRWLCHLDYTRMPEVFSSVSVCYHGNYLLTSYFERFSSHRVNSSF